MKIVLKDGTEFDLVEFTSDAFVIHCETQIEFLQCWGAMNRVNLDKVEIKDGDTVIQSMRNLQPAGVQASQNEDGTYTGRFYYFGADYVTADDEYAQAAKILLGEE